MTRAPLGIPKIAGLMASGADIALYLYQRRRGETFVLLHEFSSGKGDAGRLKVGARFDGRFYPSRCDLSPDGRHFVYFVMGGAQPQAKQRLYCWTAMSQPPSLTAMFLLPHDDTWGGGGTFIDNRNLLIEAGMHDSAGRLSEVHDRSFGGVRVQVRSGYVQIPPGSVPLPGKARRDGGWKDALKGKLVPGKSKHVKSAKRATLVRRLHPDFVTRGEFSSCGYELHSLEGDALLPPEYMAEINWADFDRKGRLFMARGFEIHMYAKPKKGMNPQPDHLLNLEAATAPA